jgi:hypothetical protein
LTAYSLLRKPGRGRHRQPSLVAGRVGRKARPTSVVVALGWGLTAAMLDTSDVLVVLDQLDQAGLVSGWMAAGG